jgi:single-strand DNA-binding protein
VLNVAVLIGRLTRDRALRSTPSGQALASCTLAVDGPFANQQGERETDFVDVVCWRTLAETVTNHVGKGAVVAVQGRVQVRSYETKDGQRRKATEVVADSVRLPEPKGFRAPCGGAARTARKPAGRLNQAYKAARPVGSVRRWPAKRAIFTGEVRPSALHPGNLALTLTHLASPKAGGCGWPTAQATVTLTPPRGPGPTRTPWRRRGSCRSSLASGPCRCRRSPAPGP